MAVRVEGGCWVGRWRWFGGLGEGVGAVGEVLLHAILLLLTTSMCFC